MDILLSLEVAVPFCTFISDALVERADWVVGPLWF